MDDLFIRPNEVSERLGVAISTAYQYVARLNDEISNQGFTIVRGKVPRSYFDEKCYVSPSDGENMYVEPKEVMDDYQVKRGKAYSIIKNLNNELSELGYFVVSGKVPRKFYEEKCYIKKSLPTSNDEATSTS